MSNKILDNMRDLMRRRHYSIRTERSYCGWVKRFVLHFNMKSRDDLRREEDRNVSNAKGHLPGHNVRIKNGRLFPVK